MRQKRQSQILKIIQDKNIKTQEQLTKALKDSGFDTTQATVSRDIKELGLIKISSNDGDYKYAQKPSGTPEQKHIDVFSNAVMSVNCALHTVVIKTYAGMAQAVCASCDMLIGNRILGSIAGDDTILIICQNEKEASDMCEELKKIFKNWFGVRKNYVM